MLSKIKLLRTLLILLLIVIFISCKKTENQNVGGKPGNIVKNTPEISVEQIKKILNQDIKVVERGKFASDSSKEVVAGTEYNSPSLWGIKFALIGYVDGVLKVIYQTDLLKGSFKESLVNKARMKDLDYNLVYYNSRDYFMGSGGGEIFSYLIDFSKQKVYTAHFITVPDKPVSLYISPNVEDTSIRNFLISKYKKDYPELKIVNKDYNLEDIF